MTTDGAVELFRNAFFVCCLIAGPAMPAFVISELTSAFQMGVIILLPFLIVDLAVASLLMSMGMMMVPPTTISLPLKLLLFVLVDGWNLVAGSILRSYT
jgi:flagellar biosynthetic protein FliP